VFGAGPVGLMAAHSAFLRGADRVFVVDKEKDRLDLAKRYEATPVDLAEADPVEQIMDATAGVGVYLPQYPGAATGPAKQGRITWDYGTFFSKGQRMGTGQCPVKRYNRRLDGWTKVLLHPAG
jgi:glutathione-independent formaldehyde dehydrogenase